MSEEKKVTAEELEAVAGGMSSVLDGSKVDHESHIGMAPKVRPAIPSPVSAGSSEQVKYTRNGGLF